MGYPTWVPVPLLPKFSSSSDASLGVEGEHGLPAPAPSRMMLRGKLRRAQLPQGTYPPTSPPPLMTGQGFRPSEPYEKGCSVTPQEDEIVRPTRWSASPAGRHSGPARVGATG
jgi:hypothetical protein